MEERARRIVETAVELAEQGGFEAVRLRDVASHAGVALGTLYRRFRSKEDLLIAALDQEVELVEQRFAQRPARDGTPLERVSSFFGLATRGLCRKPNLARSLLKAVASGDPELTQKVASFHGRMSTMIITALRGDGDRDAEPGEKERRVAFLLEMIWFASLVGWSGGLHGQAAVVEQTHSAAELILRGLDRTGK